MPVTIDKNVCVGCGACEGGCPTGAIHLGDDGLATCEKEQCIDCGACVATCPAGAITQD